MREFGGYRGHLLEGESETGRLAHESYQRRRSVVVDFDRGRYHQRAPVEVPHRRSGQENQGASLPDRLSSGAEWGAP